jgi:hypothetical protein
MNEPHFQGWNTNNKKTSISTLKVKYPRHGVSSVKFKPHTYQDIAIEKIYDTPKAGLFLDMGLRQDSYNTYCSRGSNI